MLLLKICSFVLYRRQPLQLLALDGRHSYVPAFWKVLTMRDPTPHFRNRTCIFSFHIGLNLATACYLILFDAAIARSSFAISEKDGLEAGSVDQHLSINDLHAGSHQVGISGRRSSLIIPAGSITSQYQIGKWGRTFTNVDMIQTGFHSLWLLCTASYDKYGISSIFLKLTNKLATSNKSDK